ncbi:hypothetical protein KA107_00935 [Candidatus Pacearchaeota archaeon]|nr:hypothetical protein [Candidatus Pacearchaeota archaeon]
MEDKGPKQLREIDFERLKTAESLIVEHHVLLRNIKNHLPMLERKLAFYSDRLEGLFYRTHYGSKKLSGIQNYTCDIVETLRSLSPVIGQPISETFDKIYAAGTVAEELNGSENWNRRAMPLLNAFLHAEIFLRTSIEQGRKLKYAPQLLPEGWAAVLCFYNLR